MKLQDFLKKYENGITKVMDEEEMAIYISTVTSQMFFEIMTIEGYELAYIMGSYEEPGKAVIVLDHK